MSAAPKTAVAAASAALLRDGPNGPEVLLLRRTESASFAPGAWVFPGGRVDPGDVEAASGAVLPAARHAAARETAEEAGLTVSPADLRPLARWSPPPTVARIFITWILLGPAPPDQTVTVDGGEIVDHRWLRPADALAAHGRGELEFLPPTWVTLWNLASRPTVAAVLDLAGDTPEIFESRMTPIEGGQIAMWRGDAGYDQLDASTDPAAGRHRLWMVGSDWRYERTPPVSRRRSAANPG